MPPAFCAILIPKNPPIAPIPPSFAAAVLIASVCPPTMRAAAIFGLVVIMFSSHSVIFFLWSSGIDTPLMLTAKSSIPRFSFHSALSSSASAFVTSFVCAGISEYIIFIAEICANAGLRASKSSLLSISSISERLYTYSTLPLTFV